MNLACKSKQIWHKRNLQQEFLVFFLGNRWYMVSNYTQGTIGIKKTFDGFADSKDKMAY